MRGKGKGGDGVMSFEGPDLLLCFFVLDCLRGEGKTKQKKKI